MAGFDDEILGAPPAKPPVHAIGQPIDDLSAPNSPSASRCSSSRSSGSSAPSSTRKATRNAAAAFFKS